MLKKVFLLGILLAGLVISPVSALVTNNTANTAAALVSTSYVHDITYISVGVEFALIAIGLLSLCISKWEPVEDIFCLIAFIFLAMSAWFANFMTQEYTVYAVYAEAGSSVQTLHTVYTQVITQNPYLSIALVICTIFAIINILYIYYIKPHEEELSAKNPR